MCHEHQQTCADPDDWQAYRDIEEQIGHCSPDQAWAMYFVSTGAVREHIALAVAKHIAMGNKGLLIEFPDLALAKKGDYKL